MGRYLHPQTEDKTILERLAGVPEGTATKLETLEAEHGDHSDALYEAFYNGHDDEHTLHSFLLFGWGKFVGIPGENYAGQAKGAEAQRLLDLNNIDADAVQIGGVCWS